MLCRHTSIARPLLLCTVTTMYLGCEHLGHTELVLLRELRRVHVAFRPPDVHSPATQL